MNGRHHTFQFPKENQRHLFSQIDSPEGLKALLKNLANSRIYQRWGIRYTIRDFDISQQGSKDKLNRIIVYLTCCGEKDNRPIIQFTSRNGGRYSFQSEMSIFQHDHSVDEDDDLSAFLNGESREQIQNDNDGQSDESQSEKDQEIEVIIKSEESQSVLASYFPYSPQKSLKKPQKNHLISQLENEKNSELMQVKEKPANKSQVFQFPSKLQISKLKSHRKKNSIKSSFHYYFIKDKRFCNGDYNTKCSTFKNQKGLTTYRLEFKFNCCKGVDNKQPYLLFQGRRDNDFKLKVCNLLHDHIKKEVEKKKLLDPPSRIKNIIKRYMDQAQKRKPKQQQFEFPLKSELKELQRFSNAQSMKKAYEKLTQLPHHKGKNIILAFRMQMFSSRTPQMIIDCHGCVKNIGYMKTGYLKYNYSGNLYSLSKDFNLTHTHEVRMNQMQQEPQSERQIDQSYSSIKESEQEQSQQKQQIKNVRIQTLLLQPRPFPRMSAPTTVPKYMQKSLPVRASQRKIVRKQLSQSEQEQEQEIEQSNKNEFDDNNEEKRSESRGRGGRGGRGGRVGKSQRGGNRINTSENAQTELNMQNLMKISQKTKANKKRTQAANAKNKQIRKEKAAQLSSQKVDKQKKIAKAPRVRNRKPKLIQQIGSLAATNKKNNIPLDKQLILKLFPIKQTVLHKQKHSQRPLQIRATENQKIISQQQQIDHASQIYQQSQKNHWNLGNKSKQQEMIIYWLQRYSEKLYQQLLQNSLSTINMTQVRQSLQKESREFSALIRNRRQTKRNWNECIERLLNSQNIQRLQIPTLASQNSQEFQYENILFVTSQLQKIKKSGQQPKDDSSLLLYIGVFPMKISLTQQSLNLTVAYTLTKSLQAQLVWFCFTKQNQNTLLKFEDIIVQKSNQNPLLKFIRESIIHFQLEKVKFIYTSLNYQLIDALKKLHTQFSHKNSKVQLDFQMHLQCIKALITGNFDNNSKIMQSVSDSIKKSPNVNDIMKSFYFIKDVLTMNKTELKNFNQDCRNPRIIHLNYQTFADVFCQRELQEFQKMGLNFLSSEYFNEKEHVGITDPVNQIKTIFNDLNKLNILEEALVLLMVFFDPKRKNGSSTHKGSSLIPKEINIAYTQCLNYKSIFSQQQKSEYFSIESIISEPAYELLKIARQCPRIITQTIYRLIHLANEIKSREDNLLNYRNSGQQMHSYSDMDLHMRRKVTQTNQQPPKIDKFGKPVPKVDKGEKKWSCGCNFYKISGIPCEKQILFALKHRTSLFKEIHSNWKHTI